MTTDAATALIDSDGAHAAADLADAGTPEFIAGLAALPDDVRSLMVERALADLRERGQVEDFDPTPGANPDGERAPLTDITATDRTRVIVFSMLTGDPHEIMRIDRPRVLRLRLPDGKPAFWSPGMPGRPPRRNVGSVMCYLHPDFPERKKVDGIGFANRFCNDGDRRKANRNDFSNTVDRDNHAERKHPAFWAAWQRNREEERTARLEAATERQTEAMLAMIEKMSAPSTASMFECEECDDFVTTTQRKLNNHMKAVHPNAA